MKIASDISLAGANVWLPDDVETTADAVARGAIPADKAAELGVVSVPVAPAGLIPPDMAVHAARTALAAAARSPQSVGLLIHSCIWHQGHDMWSAPHYIAARLGADEALPVTFTQGCNAVMPALELGIARLLTEPDADDCVLLTAADRFLTPGFDRWQGSYGCAHGDAATAAVLQRGAVDGGLLVRALNSRAVPELEEMNRAGQEPTTAPRARGENVSLRPPKKAYLDRYGMDRFNKRAGEAMREVIRRSLAEAGVEPGDPRIRAVTMPRMSDKIIEGTYRPIIDEVTGAPALPLHRHTGHLSCSDVLANVADLRAGVLQRPGDIGIVLNAGGGYTWSALVLEVPQQ